MTGPKCMVLRVEQDSTLTYYYKVTIYGRKIFIALAVRH
jgi:hypothetical protein